jgi:hypothetical protein
MSRARDIAAALGGARREGRSWRCRCPIHGGCSLTLRDGRDRLLVRCWAGCDTRDVLAELRRLHLLDGNSGSDLCRIADIGHDRAERERWAGVAQRVWQAAKDARGSPVMRYLAARGIPPAAAVAALGTRVPASQRHRIAGDDRTHRRHRRR